MTMQLYKSEVQKLQALSIFTFDTIVIRIIYFYELTGFQ